ncbi:neutral/alkaline non-lysosomal ceramidase N-terminal domain-containing protein [Flammeovirga sp. SJP92]|uniref:neutral/alkaline non-lysosomal ceramidase N-terminal domain-containing protein n=1 Tax=Flammeovirga sp. SJP92 TaxID=1775430 RepID=UPI0007896C10|nr:neutral/alkaline non-lysosomal ceramidase N-terminal domain-containing protein [Flammeovirga sp. SJP92]KXX67976.1 hypothetical protein AVL50_24265 [Flammeovirga sp. SJP92]
MVKKISYFVAGLLILAFVLIGRIDRTPLHSTEEYKNTILNTDNIISAIHKEVSTQDTLLIGWSAKSIVPKGVSLPVAGYGFRTSYTIIRDSLYARAFAFDDGIRESFVLTLDLMIFPIEVRKRLEKLLPTIGLTADQVLFSAIHTHNGMGGFDPSFLGSVSMGKYSEEATQKITEASFNAIKEARNTKSKGGVGFLQTESPDWVRNRIVDGGRKENSIRAIKISRTDGKQAVITTYNAHATCLNMDFWIYSRDYPGEFIDHLENKPSVDFAMYCAGMVASHGPNSPHGEKDFEMIKHMGQALSDSIFVKWEQTPVNYVIDASIHKVEVDFRPSQVRIEKNLKVRDWVFKMASGGLQGDITYFKLGDIDWFGTPSDFSGEIALDYKFDSLAKEHNKNFMLSSFNGNYVGYITCDAYYDSLHSYEIREMNWVGPEYGAYFGDVIEKLIRN